MVRVSDRARVTYRSGVLDADSGRSADELIKLADTTTGGRRWHSVHVGFRRTGSASDHVTGSRSITARSVKCDVTPGAGCGAGGLTIA